MDGKCSIGVLYAQAGLRSDGIRDYSVQLVNALNEVGGARAVLYLRNGRWRWRPEKDRFSGQATGSNGRLALDAVLLQYNPFSYGRWGFAPELPAAVSLLRRGAGNPTVGIMVHEPYVSFRSSRFGPIFGTWQRLQLAALRANADALFASTESWAARLGEHRPARPVHHLPVGSNLPDRRTSRLSERRMLKLSDESLVLASFGTPHPTRLTGYIASAVRAVRAEGCRVILLNLGDGAPTPQGIPSDVEVHSPGPLPLDALARRLAAADIFLAPLEDGVSTRRTTIMAALQHGIPVVGTDGERTGQLMRRSEPALRLTPVRDRAAFIETVRALASNSEERARAAFAARELYEDRFDWPVLTAQLIECLRLDARCA